MKPIVATLLCALSITFMSACGGGGGGGGGTGGSATPPTSYTVTPVAGTGGGISPNTVQHVNSGSTATFTVSANTGYFIDTVTGCNGSLTGNTYVTGAITANCTVTANFTLNQPAVQPTRAVVKLSTAGISAPIGALDVVLALPAGVSVQTVSNSTEAAPGTVVASGQAIANSLLTAVYSSSSNTLRVVLINSSTTGFSAGEFATVTCSIASGANPPATGFTILSLIAYDIDGAELSGAIGSASATLITPSSTHTRAVVKLDTTGVSGQIGAVDVTITLPIGVSVQHASNPPETDPGVVAASGQALSGSVVASTYNNTAKTVRIMLVNPSGFSAGEFVTLNTDLATGAAPLSADFAISAISVMDLNGQSIPGAGVVAGVTLQ